MRSLSAQSLSARSLSPRSRSSQFSTSAFLLLAALLSGTMVVAAQAPPSPSADLLALPACTLEGKLYHCSGASLEQALAATHTVALVSQPANHASDAALAALAKSLGKTVVSPSAGSHDQTEDNSHPADLTLRLTPIEPAGVSVGSGSVDLAMLNLFLPIPGNPLGRLVWSETYRGDPDMPWPAIVRALTLQFRSRLPRS